MNTANCFKLIFDIPFTDFDNVVSIHEPRGDAKIHYLNIFGKETNFIKFDEALSKRIGNLFTTKTYCKKNADGVIFYQKDNITHLLICELKSSKTGISDSAFEQAASTYIKTIMVFSICDGFTLDDTNIFFIFTAKDNGDLLLELSELQESDINTLSPMEKKRLALLRDKHTTIRLPEISNSRKAFCTRICEKDIKCILTTSKESDTIDLDIKDIV